MDGGSGDPNRFGLGFAGRRIGLSAQFCNTDCDQRQKAIPGERKEVSRERKEVSGEGFFANCIFHNIF
jgi:peptide deformylase